MRGLRKDLRRGQRKGLRRGQRKVLRRGLQVLQKKMMVKQIILMRVLGLKMAMGKIVMMPKILVTMMNTMDMIITIMIHKFCF